MFLVTFFKGFMFLSILSSIKSFFSFSDCPEVTRKRFFYLGFAAFAIMFAQWPIKVLKDGLLISEVGADNKPWARAFSVVLCFLLSLGYGQLVSKMRRENVIYFLTGVLSVIGFAFFVLITLYMQKYNFPFPKEYVVYGFYTYVDVFIVLTLPTFWAFVNDISLPAEAKRAYGFLAFMAQAGGLVAVLLGKWILGEDSSSNSSFVLLASLIAIVVYAFSIFFMVQDLGHKNLKGYDGDHKPTQEKHKVPFLKGLALIATSPYVLGIMILTASQEILTAVMQFRMDKTVEAAFILDKTGLNKYIFDYAVWIQIVSCTFSFLGSFFQAHFGTEICILIYPVILGVCFGATAFFPSLMVVSAMQALIKGLHYALNKPSRETLYIPTTKEVKYKSKSWIDSFGSRLFKLMGAFINKNLYGSVGIVVSGVLLLWIPMARYVGKKYKDSVKNNETIT